MVESQQKNKNQKEQQKDKNQKEQKKSKNQEENKKINDNKEKQKENKKNKDNKDKQKENKKNKDNKDKQKENKKNKDNKDKKENKKDNNNKDKQKKTKKDELVEKYKQYAETPEAFAVLFVKKYLNSSKGNWVDILSTSLPEYYFKEDLEFEKVECELFKRIIKPDYPKQEPGMSDEDYYYKCRAITWNAAHTDISQQRNKGVIGPKYSILAKKISGNKKIHALNKDNFKEITDSINKLSEKWDYILLQGIKSEDKKSKTFKFSFNDKNLKNKIQNKLKELSNAWEEISSRPSRIEIQSIKRINNQKTKENKQTQMILDRAK